MLKKYIITGLMPLLLTTAPSLAGKNTISVGMALEPTHLDPTAGAAAAIDEVTYANVYEGLTRIDSTGTVQPALAKSWTISDDGLTYTFTLNTGVKFHDGTDFNADDVVFSFNRAMGENSVNAQKGLFKTIQSVKALNPSTVQFTLSQPTGALLFNLGWGDAVIIAPESAETNKTNPIGTGPFKFGKWVKGDRIELVKNNTYWGDTNVLDKATFKFIADPSAALSALMAGDVDAFPNFPTPENIPMLQSDPRFTVVIGSTEGETILSTNNAKAPFDNIKVRQAIAHGINRRAIIDGAMFGQGTPIGSHFAPHHPAYIDLTKRYAHDTAKAKALLKEAGYPNGFDATLTLPPPSYARRSGEIIANDLKKIGIRLKIIPVEWGVWINDVFKAKNYDLTIVSHTEPQDIGIYARDNYYFNYQSDAFKTVIAELDKTADPTKRNQILGKAQKILSDDAVNGFLFQRAKAGVWDSKIQGLWENSPIQANDLTGVSWK